MQMTVENIMKTYGCSKEEAEEIFALLNGTFIAAGSSVNDMNEREKELDEMMKELKNKINSLNEKISELKKTMK